MGIAVVVGTGLSISVALFKQGRTQEQQDIAAALGDLADRQVELLEIQVTRSMESLHAVGAFLRARPTVSATEFQAFVADALHRQSELQALGWSPRVTTGVAADHFPVLHIEPRAGNEAAVGFDVFADPVRHEAMTAARDAGSPVATAPVQLVQGDAPDRRGVIVYLPVYAEAQPATADQRRRSLRGFASAVFRADRLLLGVANQFGAEGVRLAILDEEAGGAELISTGVTGEPSLVRRVAVAGRTWRLEMHATPAFVTPRSHGHAWAVLAAGSSLTLLLGAYLSAVVSRTALVERRVRQRTEQLSREVAERTRAQLAARQAEAAYRSIFDNSVEGIFQTTPDGHYLRANAALARIYGYDSSDQLIADLADIANQLYVQPGRRDEFAREIRRAGTVTNFESQVRRRDGRVIWISENARAVCDAGGNVLHYEGFVVDVTERRAAEDLQRRITEELERRVEERTEALAAANAAKSRFLASMSHEIRTPMNAILGYAQVLRRDAALPAAQRDAVASIASSGNHLLGLIDGILDLSRIEAGHVELQPADFDLGAMADDLDRMFRQRCREKGLTLTVDSPRATVRGDERKLRQVLINLMANAVRFTDAGSVELTIRRDPAGGYTFTVLDTGVGIPPDALARIFEPFQQARPAAVTRGGTGLGLTIAQQFVRLMGSELAVESHVGVGSRFSFTIDLPASLTSSKAATSWDHARLAPGESLHVLVVDDVPENRQVLGAMLESAGVTVATAADGPEGIAAAASRRFDAVLVDILMPGMDGFATARELRRALADGGGAMGMYSCPCLPPHDTDSARQSTIRSDVPLIATSAAVFAHDREHYDAAGFVDVLSKPIAAARLYQSLADATGARFDLAAPSETTTAWSAEDAAADAAQLPAGLVERLTEAADHCRITALRECLADVRRLAPSAVALIESIDQTLRTYDAAPLSAVLGSLAVGGTT